MMFGTRKLQMISGSLPFCVENGSGRDRILELVGRQLQPLSNGQEDDVREASKRLVAPGALTMAA